MSCGKDPDKAVCSYTDGIPVKISENFKPPGKVTLPLSVHRLLNSPSTFEEYNFSLEHGVLAKLEQWKKHLELQREERHKKIAEEENWSKMLDETMQELHINEVASANIEATSPISCDPVLSQCSQGRDTSVQISTTTSVPVTDSRYPTQPVLTPVPLTYTIPVAQTSHAAFNISDFEADTSSPFDNMELKTLNDMEELAHVLQPTSSASTAKYFQMNTTASFSTPQQHVATTNTYCPLRHSSISSASYIQTSGVGLNHPMQQLSQYDKTLIGVQHQLNGYASGYNAYGSVEQQHQQPPIHRESFPFMPVSAPQHYSFTSAVNTSVIPGRTLCSDQPPYNYIGQKTLPQSSVSQYPHNFYNFETRKPWLANPICDQQITVQPAKQDMSSLVSDDKCNMSLVNCQQSNGPDFVHEIGELMKKKFETPVPSHSETSNCSRPQTERFKLESATIDLLSGLNPSAQQLVKQIAEMGFPLSRVARAYTTLGDSGKTIVEYLLNLQSLMERGYSEKQVEDALAANSNDPAAAETYLEAQVQLLDLGFPADKVLDALKKFNSDRDKALEFLIT